MKTIKHILSATLTLVMFTSCSSDDDGGNQSLQTLLSKRITSTETISYNYDNNNRATGYIVDNISPENNYTTTFTYNSSGQLAEVIYNPENSIENIKVVYSYNNNGRISEIETSYVYASGGLSSPISKYEADYSTPGKVSVYKYTMAGTGTPYLNTEYYLDANGNIENQLSYGTSGLLIVTTENSNYDDKKTASASLPDEDFVRNVNNYGTVTVTATGGTPSVSTFTYEYNNDGYPIKRTSNTGSVVTYEYIKR